MNIELFERLKKEGDKTVTVNIDGTETQVMIRSPRYTHGWMAFWSDNKDEYKIEITPEGNIEIGKRKEFSYPWITCQVPKDSKRYSIILDAMRRINAPECTFFNESK